MEIHLRSLLSAKRCILREKLNKEAFRWLLGEIESKFIQSKAHPGEMVGSIAAQSIGETITQMTLNTFHFAGISSMNVTLGVPRFEEVVNVGKTIKTPSITVYLEREYAKDENIAREVQSQLEYTTLRNLTLSSEIFYDSDPTTTVLMEDQDLVHTYFEFESVNVDRMSPWVLRIVLDKNALIDTKITMEEISDKIQIYNEIVHLIYSNDNADKLVLRFRLINTDEGESEHRFKELHEFEATILNLRLKGIDRISKVFMRKEKNDETWILETNGCNLVEVMANEYVDSTRVYSNDLVELCRVLGIEAVRKALLRELRMVLGFYGIYVNYRHFSILVDVMTARGHLMAITRHGINRIEARPLLKASFEETVDMLMEAAVYGEVDNLKGPSENVMLGQLAHIGTGEIDILVD